MHVIKTINNTDPPPYETEEDKKPKHYVEELKFIELVSRYLKLEARVQELEKKAHTHDTSDSANAS